MDTHFFNNHTMKMHCCSVIELWKVWHDKFTLSKSIIRQTAIQMKWKKVHGEAVVSTFNIFNNVSVTSPLLTISIYSALLHFITNILLPLRTVWLFNAKIIFIDNCKRNIFLTNISTGQLGHKIYTFFLYQNYEIKNSTK